MKKSFVFKMPEFLTPKFIYDTYFVCYEAFFIDCGIYSLIHVALVKCYGVNGNFHVFVSYHGIYFFTLVMSDSVTELDNYRSYHKVVEHFSSLYNMFSY